MPQTRTIVTAGEMLVEFVSHSRNCGLEKPGAYSGPYPSGAPAIFADQAARMGARTAVFGGVGADGFGRSVLARLQGNGVDIGGVGVARDHTTGVAFVTYYDSGARRFIFHLDGTAATQFDIPLEGRDWGATILHVSASSLGVAALRDQIMPAVDATMANGGWITCDPNMRPELMRDAAAMDAVHTVMEQSRWVMPSVEDIGLLFPGISEDAAIDRMRATGAEIIAITRGGAGATIITPEARYDFAGHKITEIDPTGAGDCFCGTLVALLAQGVATEEAARQANAAGAIAVTRRGPMEGNSTPAEIARFLENSHAQKEAAK